MQNKCEKIHYSCLADGWKTPLPPSWETERLHQLHGWGILDTSVDPRFDNITSLVARMFGVEIALVSLVDEDRQWFKSRHGVEATQTPRNMAFCAHAILGDEPFVVLDTHADDRFRANPLVKEVPYIRFYAGAPLVDSEGYRLGTLCAISQTPRSEFSEEQRLQLCSLAQTVMGSIELLLYSRQLRRVNENKSMYLAQISHEIRTPLNGMTGMLELLHDSELNADQKRLVGQLKASSSELNRVVSRILDFSRVDAGRVEPKPEVVEPLPFLRRVHQMHRQKALEKGLEYRFLRESPFPFELEMDTVLLQQILNNLLGNAVKFTDSGFVRMHVALDSEGETLEIRIEDSGTGIAQERQATIFDAYSQLETGMLRKYGGTGLGLHIVKGIIKALQGRIELHSEPDRGTTFRFSVPVSRPLQKSTAGQAAPVRRGKDLWQSQALVVEDNAVNRVVSQRLLEKLGLRVQTAISGEEAIRLFQKTAFDVVFMDYHLPDSTGPQVVQQIRRFEEYARRRRVPVIALTANVSEEVSQECLQSGMDTYLSKPFRSEELKLALQEFFSTS